MKDDVLRLAAWSGPRNISTAMMRSWGNRPDTVVVDEPLYAHYLQVTGRTHPGRDEVIARGPTDLAEAIGRILGPVPKGKPVFYQKHMSHHLLPEMDRTWLKNLTNCFLIRDPAKVLASLIKHVPDLALEDTGFPQQAEIFELVRQWTGRIPPVVDAGDVLRDPRRILTLLCKAVGVDFTDRMLSWAPGLRDTDGVWAKYWYKEIENTTGFHPFQDRVDQCPPGLEDILRNCQEYYRRLHVHRLGQ